MVYIECYVYSHKPLTVILAETSQIKIFIPHTKTSIVVRLPTTPRIREHIKESIFEL